MKIDPLIKINEIKNTDSVSDHLEAFYGFVASWFLAEACNNQIESGMKAVANQTSLNESVSTYQMAMQTNWQDAIKPIQDQIQQVDPSSSDASNEISQLQAEESQLQTQAQNSASNLGALSSNTMTTSNSTENGVQTNLQKMTVLQDSLNNLSQLLQNIL